MRNNFARALALCALMILPATAGLGQPKIATINLQKVFDNYYKREQAQAAFDDRKKALEKEGQSMVDEYKKSMEEYNKLKDSVEDPSITPQERESRKTKAQMKLEEVKSNDAALRTFETNAREKLALQTQQMLESLMKDVKTAVEAMAKKEGYALVIDTSAESYNQIRTSFVLYSNGELDITEAILKQLNAAAPASTTNKASATPKPDGKN